jgi:argininosuccinate lyase
LGLEEFKAFYEGFDPEVTSRIKLENAVDARNNYGGTATEAVKERIREFEKTFVRK